MQTVYVSGRQRMILQPQDMIGSGGEGNVFRAMVGGSSMAIKIYHTRSDQRVRKLESLVSMTLLPDEVVVPRHLVHDEHGQVVGYTMRLLSPGQEVLETLSDRKFRESNGITTTDVVDIHLGIQRVLKRLHGQGVIVGDLNSRNELYLGTRVSLIDADSFQVGRYPCEVATEKCLHPRLYGVDLSLRPVFECRDDWYAFCVLLFSSLLLVHPYGGAHRTLRTIPKRAMQKVTVLDPGVVYPLAAISPEIVSDELLHLFSQVFAKGTDLVEVSEALLLEYRAALVECPACHTMYPNSRKKCPGCAAVNRILQAFKATVSGVKVLELFSAHGPFVFFKLVETTMYGVAIESGQAVLYSKLQMEAARRVVLFPAVKGARYDVFGSTLVVNIAPYSSPSELLLYDISGVAVKLIGRTMTDGLAGRSAVFRGSSDFLYRTIGGVILRSQLRGGNLLDTTVATGMEHQTWFDVTTEAGRELLFGYYRVYEKYQWFMLLDGSYRFVEIANLDKGESQVDRAVRFSRSSMIVLRRTKMGGQDFCRIDMVDIASGKVVSSRKVEVSASPHFANIHNSAYSQGVVLVPGLDGLVAENAQTGNMKVFPETANILSSDSQLWPYDGGVLVVTRDRVYKLTLQK